MTDRNVCSFTAILKRVRKAWRDHAWKVEYYGINEPWRKIVYFCRSRKPCPDCDHAARDHYKRDPWNGERGCVVAWQCNGYFDAPEWDGCDCKWTGWGPMPRYCKCGEPEYEHEDGVTWNCKGFEEKKIA